MGCGEGGGGEGEGMWRRRRKRRGWDGMRRREEEEGCGEEKVVHQPQVSREAGPGCRGMTVIPLKWRASEAEGGGECSLVRAAETVSGFKPDVSTKTGLENTNRPQPRHFSLLYRCSKIRTAGSS